MVLDRQHVARERRRGIARRLLHLRFETPAHILRLRRGVERLGLGLLELLFELGDMVMFRQLRRASRRFLADFLGLFMQMVFIFRCFCHAINLVSAFAVKSTMGTTRA